MPIIALQILQWFTAIATTAPQFIELGKKLKEFFSSMTGAGQITKTQQDALFARVDAICEAAEHGIFPPSWDVEPNPTDN